MLAAMAPHDCHETASSVATGGPATKTTSSSTPSSANDVRTSPASLRTYAHRARIAEPTWGIEPSPSAIATNHVQTGASASTRTTRSTSITTEKPTAHGNTRCWV